MRERGAVKIKAIMAAIEIVTVLIVAILAALFGRIVETIILYIAFALTRFLIGESFHAKGLFACMGISCATMLFLIPGTLPTHDSVLFAVFVGISLAVAAHYVAGVIKKLKKLKEYEKPFECYTATIEEFQKRCLQKGFTEEKTSFAIDAVSCQRLSNKNLTIKYYGNMDGEPAAKQRKRRVKHELED